MRSPVVNRPTIEGMHSSNTQSVQAKLLRLATLFSDLVPAEVYVSVDDFDRGTYEVASLTKSVQGDEIDSGSTQTYRGRKRLPPGWLYLQTIFCGESVWVKHDSYGNLDFGSASYPHPCRGPGPPARRHLLESAATAGESRGRSGGAISFSTAPRGLPRPGCRVPAGLMSDLGLLAIGVDSDPAMVHFVRACRVRGITLNAINLREVV